MHARAHGTDARVGIDCIAAIRVLASGSRGNCTLFAYEAGGRRRLAMVDIGLSPQRTSRLLQRLSLRLDDIEHVLLTHLDCDHCHASWARALPEGTALHLHRRHVSRALEMGIGISRMRPFDEAFALAEGVTVYPQLQRHDQDGVSVFRFGLKECSIGFATDVGRVTDTLIDHLRGVEVLAIEANYCPRMQLASSRPEFLKRRIMGGSGHLSNEQSARAVAAIAPAQHVVLLHLSQECNDPERAAAAHTSAGYELTLSHQEQPTPWIRVRARAGARVRPVQTGLFDMLGSPARV